MAEEYQDNVWDVAPAGIHSQQKAVLHQPEVKPPDDNAPVSTTVQQPSVTTTRQTTEQQLGRTTAPDSSKIYLHIKHPPTEFSYTKDIQQYVRACARVCVSVRIGWFLGVLAHVISLIRACAQMLCERCNILLK